MKEKFLFESKIGKNIIFVALTFLLFFSIFTTKTIADSGRSVDGIYEYEYFSDGTAYIKGIVDGSYYPTNMKIPSTLGGYTVIHIAYRAFYYCDGLERVEIPEGVTNINSEAFSHCFSLKEVILPKSISRIDTKAFYFCSETSLDVIYNGDINDWLRIRNDGISGYNLYFNDNIVEEVKIPDNIREIPARAFSGCASIKNVIIPDSITSIGSYAFSGCTGIESIIIPDSITRIEQCAFLGCDNLTTVYLSKRIAWIGYSAFECETLTDIYYGGSQTDRESIHLDNAVESHKYLISANWNYNYNQSPPEETYNDSYEKTYDDDNDNQTHIFIYPLILIVTILLIIIFWLFYRKTIKTYDEL